jgi:uncharacterized Zn finger protein
VSIECPRCGSEEFHDVTSFEQRPMTSLMCAECGTPWVMVQRANPIHSMEGPSVPTPEDILRAATLLL